MSPTTGLSDTMFQNGVRLLLEGESPRVWSLIVTFFGDLARTEGDQVSGALLTKLGQLAGIKPEAMRVALHRLRRDGWIDSRRVGRGSQYFLTEHGRRESAAASPRIYAGNETTAKDWTLLVAEPGKTVGEMFPVLPKDVVKIGDRVAIATGGLVSGEQKLLAVTGPDITVPEWVKSRLIDTQLTGACDQLLTILESLEQFDLVAADLSETETAILRVLIVHRWRRVRLRQPDVPDRFFPDSWKGAECRLRVTKLLLQLPRPALHALETLTSPSDGQPDRA